MFCGMLMELFVRSESSSHVAGWIMRYIVIPASTGITDSIAGSWHSRRVLYRTVLVSPACRMNDVFPGIKSIESTKHPGGISAVNVLDASEIETVSSCDPWLVTSHCR